MSSNNEIFKCKIMNVIKYCFVLILMLLVGCVNSKKAERQTQSLDQKLVRKSNDIFEVISPQYSNQFIIGEEVDFTLNLSDSTKVIDSLYVFLNEKLLATSHELEFSKKLSPAKVGENKLTISAFSAGATTQSKSLSLLFLSDLKPKEISYSVVNKYPHSTDNFTEGLIYYQGALFEGTGLRGKSFILESDLKTGKVINSLSLESRVFGEGITIFKDKIVQLTYTLKVGYVYDRTSFEKLETFDTSFSDEGWGLTNDGSNLLMSNGTNKILYLNPNDYSYIKNVSVYDDEKSISNLNELEYIDGLLYANIWMENRIAQIEPKSGKVLGYLDLSDLVPTGMAAQKADVLNGIAYNYETGNLLVTGKFWDFIYEIKLKYRN